MTLLPSAGLAQAGGITDWAMGWWNYLSQYLPRVGLGILVFVVFLTVAGAIRAGAVRAITKAVKDERAGNAWGTIIQYLVILLGVAASLAVLGVNLGSMMIALGAVGIAVGFALQDIIANFVSGLILLTSHPFARGDRVGIGGVEGTVARVGMRATMLRTFDGLRVEVPNKSVLSNNITIFSFHDTRRWDVLVGVGYDDDITGAKETVLKAVENIQGVRADPAPEIFVDELGGSSVNLKARFWTDATARGNMLATKSDVTQAVKEALVAEGYDIPYPIRTVYNHQVNGQGA
ncbi:MAG: mechanosensitive ion channel family protein [Candidatus Thermoplasmatota archaeon]|nr:mechanosensitive ion channel family protein [Candidatus Thermoplasmatota archaeon]